MKVPPWVQPTAQITFGVFLTSLLTFARPISFSLSCLSAVFVMVLHLLLVQNWHVGTLMLSAAGLLGCVWSGIAAAGILVTITMQIPVRAGRVALLVVLASGGFALCALVRVTARQFPLLFLQGTNCFMTFGMSVVLSLFAPNATVLWSNYLSHMLLAFTGAGLASVLAGLLVLPSLATEAALATLITALNRTGQTGTMCISILLAPLQAHQLTSLTETKEGQQQPVVPGDQQPLPQQALLPAPGQQQQPHWQSQPQQQPQLQQQPSLLLEDPETAASLSSFVQSATEPGRWGLRSFLAAAPPVLGSAGPSGRGPGPDGADGHAAAAAAAAAAAVAVAVAAVPGLSQQPQQPQQAQPHDGVHHDDDADVWGHDHFEEEDEEDGSSLGMPGSGEEGSSHQQHHQQHQLHVLPQHDAAGSPAIGIVCRVRCSINEEDYSSTAPFHIISSRSPTASGHSSGSSIRDGGARARPHRSGADDASTSTSGGSSCGGTSSSVSHHARLDIISTGSSPSSSQDDVAVAKAAQQQQHHHHLHHPHSHLHHQHKQQHKQPQQQPQPPQQQGHHLIRLQRGVDQIRPLMQGVKQLRNAVTVEQVWWVGLLCGAPGRAFDPPAYHAMVDALDGLLDRVSALESMLEGGHDYASLAHLTTYRALVTTCGSIMAQAAALCGALSSALQHRLQQLQRRADVTAVCGASGCTRGRPPPAAAATGTARGSGSISGSIRSVRSSGGSAPLPGKDAAAGWAVSDSLVAAGGALLGPCHWQEHQQSLLDVLHAETQAYYAALAAADKGRPFRLDPARSMVALMFLATLCMGAIEASQRLQAAVQAVLDSGDRCCCGCSCGSSSATASDRRPAGSSGPFLGQPQQQPQRQQQPARGVGSGVRLASSSVAHGSAPSHAIGADAAANVRRRQAGVDGTSGQQATAAAPTGNKLGTTPEGPISASSSSSSMGAVSSWLRAVWWRLMHPLTADTSSSGTRLLLEVLLMVDVGKRIWEALLVQLPAACASWTAFKQQLHDRRFQAGFKAWLAATIALVLIAATYTLLLSLGRQGASITMFGFMSIVFTMRERVESSMEMVIIRVGGTIVGACLAHLLMFNPATAYNHWILGASLIVACLATAPISTGQFRLLVVLSLLTFASVELCQFVGCCGAVGSTTYLIGRILATGGGSLFAMLLNRGLWPWYRNCYAREELTKATALAVAAAADMYRSEYRHIAALAGRGGAVGGTGKHPAGAAAPAAAADQGLAASAGGAGPVQRQQQHLVQLACGPRLAGSVQQPGGQPLADDAVAIRIMPDRQAAPAGSQQGDTMATGPSPPWPGGTSGRPGGMDSHSSSSSSSGGSAAGVSLAAEGDAALDPAQVQRQLLAIVMPVQVSVARDTWMTWRKGALALAPGIPVMLSAVQQLLDAFTALSITLKLIHTAEQMQERPPQQHRAAAVASCGPSSADVGSGIGSGVGNGSSTAGISGNSGASRGDRCTEWQQQMLFDELARPVHGSVCELLQQLQELVGLAVEHVRQPRAAGRQALLHKIEAFQQLRVSVSLHYVTLRNQRHRKMRQTLAAAWGQQQQQPGAAVVSSTGSAEQPRAQPPDTGGDGSAAAPAGGVVGGTGMASSQQQVLAIVQYMAFIHALRRLVDRAVAVARCAVEA